jgi:hypothetical protein
MNIKSGFALHAADITHEKTISMIKLKFRGCFGPFLSGSGLVAGREDENLDHAGGTDIAGHAARAVLAW